MLKTVKKYFKKFVNRRSHIIQCYACGYIHLPKYYMNFATADAKISFPMKYAYSLYSMIKKTRTA